MAGALVIIAVLAVGGTYIAGDDGDNGRAGGPRALVSTDDFPVPLRSEPPGSAGDVSRAFVDPDGERVLLNGVNIFPVYPDPPRLAFRAADYRAIREKGFNVVRFLLPWAMYEKARGRFEHLGKLDAAVRHARQAGLYVVMLNMIVDQWNRPPAWAAGGDKLDRIERHGRAWTQELARRYEDEPAVAAYDLGAELPSANQDRVLGLYERLIGWVREIDSDKILITTAGWGNSDMSRARVDPAPLGEHRNIIYSFHDYFAGDGNPHRASAGFNEHGMVGGYQVWDGISGYPDPGDKDDLAAHLEHHIAYARRANLPMWVAEYGIGPAAENAREWVSQKTKLYDRHGIGRAWWLYNCGDDFSLKDDSCNWRWVADAIR